MSDLIIEVEARRQALRMSQSEVSKALHVSQGQYSKVIAGRVALTAKMVTRLKAWLDAQEPTSTDLDHQISLKCMELMHLLQQRQLATSEQVSAAPPST